jgi:hypothetical protein
VIPTVERNVVRLVVLEASRAFRRGEEISEPLEVWP